MFVSVNRWGGYRPLSSHVGGRCALSLALLLFVLLIGTGLAFAPTVNASFSPTLSVYFFDVDQGDSTLFVGEDFTILVDAGRHDRSEVVPLLQSVGINAIDLFIVTHPHADHIGQCAPVMHNFAVGEVWMSGDTHTTLTFERCLDAVIESGAGYHEPRAGEAYELGSARIEVVHPDKVTGDLNNGSVSVRIIYGNVAFLLTGDAEREAEQSMLARGHNLQAHIMKLGHHGSRTSSTDAFLRSVQPQLAIYSAGSGNTYGHPHGETLRTAAQRGVTVYGTDVNGTIRLVTDGTRYEVIPTRGQAVIEGSAAIAVGSAGTVLPASGVAASLGAGSSLGCGPGQVDINTAESAALTRIIHIGPALATRIIDSRPFHSVDDLIRVSGIAERRLADIKNEGIACVR